MATDDPEGFSEAFKFYICLVYMIILVLSRGAPRVLTRPRVVP
jgi:hypothetical protein